MKSPKVQQAVKTIYRIDRGQDISPWMVHCLDWFKFGTENDLRVALGLGLHDPLPENFIPGTQFLGALETKVWSNSNPKLVRS